jgi:hypothetical protein
MSKKRKGEKDMPTVVDLGVDELGYRNTLEYRPYAFTQMRWYFCRDGKEVR